MKDIYRLGIYSHQLNGEINHIYYGKVKVDKKEPVLPIIHKSDSMVSKEHNEIAKGHEEIMKTNPNIKYLETILSVEE